MLKTIIFDFDGVISNSEPAHFATFQRILCEEGIDINEADYFQKYLAMDDRGAFTAALRDAGRTAEADQLRELIMRKAGYFHKFFQERITVYPDAINFIEMVASRFPLAINSGALRAEIEQVLNFTQLHKHFSLIVSAEDVKCCKPDPEGYLTALARLNESHRELAAQPSECLVIEDSVGGIKAAIAAGMRCVAVTNTYPADRLTQATVIVSSLAELTDDYLTRLFLD